MAQFITTTFAGGNDIALQLGNEEWVRQLAIGSTWSYIRIGILFQLTGTANTSSGGFSIGVCSGTSAPFGNTSCQNFVGIEIIAGLNWTANAPFPYYSLTASNAFACKKIGSSITTYGSNLADSVGMCFPTSSGTARRGLIYVDITKGSPNYTVGMMMTTNTYASHDYTVAELLSGMTPPFSNTFSVGGTVLLYGNGAVTTVATDETLGGFDTVDIYSNELNNPFNIFEVAVEKLA
jgi:hypothetical protein